MSESVFDKIVERKIPADVVYEDEMCIAFRDINPVAKVHVLLIPKKKDGLDRLSNAEERHKDILGHLMGKVGHVASIVGVKEEGFRVVVNNGGHGGQEVEHLHLHIIGGQQLFWPPGTVKTKL